MGILGQLIREEMNEIDVVRARHFFLNVSSGTTPETFSYIIHRVCDNPHLSQGVKFSLLSQPMQQYADLLTVGAVRNYLETVSKDTVLVKTLLRRFAEFPIPVGREMYWPLDQDSPEVSLILILLRAIKIISPDDRWIFARLALKKFPNLPANVLLYTQGIAGFRGPRKVTDLAKGRVFVGFIRPSTVEPTQLAKPKPKPLSLVQKTPAPPIKLKEGRIEVPLPKNPLKGRISDKNMEALLAFRQTMKSGGGSSHEKALLVL